MIDWVKENVIAVVLGSVAVLVAILLFLGFHTTEIPGKVISKEWSRTIYIQKYDWVHHSREGSSSPEGAINIKKWSESESYTTTDSDGKIHHKTKWVNHISYDVQEWTYSREVNSRGNHPEIPFWPSYTLGSRPPEREGSRNDEYIIVFKIKDKIKKFKPDQEEYDRISNREEYVCRVNGFGFVTKVQYGD